jgi:hypothetical protein
MTRTILSRTAIVAAWAVLPWGVTPAGELPRYSRPEGAKEVLEAKDLPFKLFYDGDKWELGPQRSQLRLLARAVHKDGNVSGAFVYREGDESVEAIRERAVDELETAFASHEVTDFSRRRVNGLEILFMQARATTEDGASVEVRNYYWQGPEGVADYGLAANEDMLERYRDDMMDLLNGLTLREGAGAGDHSNDDSP